MKPQDNLSLDWVTGGMNGLCYMDSSVVFECIGCTEHRLPVHCNATPLEVPGWVLGRCATPRATYILSPVHSVCQVTCTLLR
jgi:hypothetical protein